MTKEEAIEILKTDSCVDCGVGSQSPCTCTFNGHCDIKDAMDIAIKALEQQPTTQEILSHIETGITATGQSDSYCVGFCNALVWLKSCITHEEPQYFEDGKKEWE